MVSGVDPFGDADAARADLFDPSQFVDFRGLRSFRADLGMAPDDGEVRVIVGGKGAGKTIYLRRLQTGLSRNQSLYVDDWRNRPPATRDVLRVWSWSSSTADCRLRWSILWRRAILRSVVSHVLHGKMLKARVPTGMASDLREDFPELLPRYEERSSIVTQVETIIREYDNCQALDAYLHHPRWEVVELRLIEALDDAPPLFFFLDALDEEFESAPSQWLDCQAGLLTQVLELRSNQRLGAQLHVIIGVRDLVYSTTQNGEHATRYRRVPGIRNLRWNREAISYFLHEKLAALDPQDWLLQPRAEDPVERWLGLKIVDNPRRRCKEVAEDYVLRHTRMIPRDIIQMGNALCDRIDQAVDKRERVLTDEIVRRTVADVSRASGMEQLYVVANHVAADLMPREAVDHGYSESYIDPDGVMGASDEISRAYQRALREALSELQVDRVTARRLDAFATRMRRFGKVDVLSILWQHRLLGYVDGRRRLHDPVVFYSAEEEDSLELPHGKAHYALHPILIDAVDRLRGVGQAVALS